MHIWVDADACPILVKEVLFKAARRVNCKMTFVANQPVSFPPFALFESILVPAGDDEADKEILRLIQEGELLISADIPLIADVVAKGAFAINPRGEFYSKENAESILATRNFMEDLRSAGVETGGPPAFSLKEKQAFANQLDKFLAKHRQK